MKDQPCEIPDVPGFRTGAAACGLKPEGPGGREPDVGVILCESAGGTGCAVISHGAVYSPSAKISSPRATSGYVRAVIVNSGNANCCTGDKGLADAREMIRLASEGLSVPQEQIILASAGEAGVPLPMDRVREGLEAACRDALDGGRGDVATAVLPPGGARRIAHGSGSLDGKPFRIAGLARGLSFEARGAPARLALMVTDAALGVDCLTEMLRDVVSRTFERLEFDRGTSPGDTVCLLASGRAGNTPAEDVYSAGEFIEALEEVAKSLALDLAFEGEEGARLVEVSVTGAASDEDADLAVRAIAGSDTVRMALHRAEPAWGLVLAAAGRLGARVVESRVTVRMGGVVVSERGRSARSVPDDLAERLGEGKITVELDLGLGEGVARLWTSDLSDGERERVHRMETERDEARREREEIEKKLREVKSARDAAAREAKAARFSLELAEQGRKKLSAAGSDLGELRKKIDELETEKKAAAKEMKKLRFEIEIAERRGARKAGGAKKGAAGGGEESAGDQKALKKKLAASEKARKAAEKEVASIKERLERTRMKTVEVSTERDSLREELEKALDAAGGEGGDLEEEVERLRLEMENRESESEELLADIERFRSLDKAREKEADELDKKLEAARAEVAGLKAQIELKEQLVKQLMGQGGG